MLSPFATAYYPEQMSHRRLATLVVAAAVLGSQAGHLLVYELRFGSAAGQLQSTGAHFYFPAVAKTGLGIASLGLKEQTRNISYAEKTWLRSGRAYSGKGAGQQPFSNSSRISSS